MSFLWKICQVDKKKCTDLYSEYCKIIEKYYISLWGKSLLLIHDCGLIISGDWKEHGKCWYRGKVLKRMKYKQLFRCGDWLWKCIATYCKDVWQGSNTNLSGICEFHTSPDLQVYLSSLQAKKTQANKHAKSSFYRNDPNTTAFIFGSASPVRLVTVLIIVFLSSVFVFAPSRRWVTVPIIIYLGFCSNYVV